MSAAGLNAMSGLLLIPAGAAVLLALLPGYRLTARLNVLATALTLLCALSLFFRRPEPGAYLLVDDLNGTFVVLTTFVGFTTSVFSLNNIGLMWVAIELATLTTVMMVGIYRTHEALEAAWKYFILGSIGIALALFG